MSYCGINRPPKGKRIGTIDECNKSKQIRYYGLHAVDPKLLKKNKKHINIVDEQLKLRIFQERGKRLVRDYKNLNEILEDEESTVSQKKKAKEKIKKIIAKRDPLLKKLRDQKELLRSLDKKRG